MYVVGVSVGVQVGVQFFILIESFSSSVEIGVWAGSFFVTSTFHFITSISVPFVELWFTAKIVHLTAAVESVVCISNSLWSFSLVALVQIVPVSSANCTKVVRLFHLGKSNLFKVSSLFFSRIETDQSEKNNSKSSVQVCNKEPFL
jgi:hypothetical protein